MKIPKVRQNIIFFTAIMLITGVVCTIYWYSSEKKQQEIEECKIKKVDRYLDERYGDKRPGLDIRIIMDVNKEALADCSH